MAHRLVRGCRERTPLARVADEVGDARAEVAEVAGAVEPAVDARAHQVDRSPGPGRHHRDAAGERLLDRLAERLALAGMHEHVEARQRLGERAAGEVAGEHAHRAGPARAPAGPGRRRRSRGACRRGRRAPRGLRPASRGRGGRRTRRSSCPARHARARRRCAAPARSGRCRPRAPTAAAGRRRAPRAGCSDAVDGARVRVARRCRRATWRPTSAAACGIPYFCGVRDDVGLVDGDGGHAQRIGRREPLPAEHERRGQVHDVGPELAEDRRQPRGSREDDAHLGIRRQRRRAQQLGAGAVEVGGDLSGARRDDERLVTFGREVAQDVEHGPCHPVHVGQERFGEQCDSHASRVTARTRTDAANRRPRASVHPMHRGRSPDVPRSVAVHRGRLPRRGGRGAADRGRAESVGAAAALRARAGRRVPRRRSRARPR